MAYDSARNRVVLFAGQAGFFTDSVPLATPGSGTGKNGSKRSTTGPGPRWGHAMAYDSLRGKVVMFGGYRDLQSQVRSDTWEWNGTEWSQVVSSSAVPPRARRTRDGV